LYWLNRFLTLIRFQLFQSRSLWCNLKIRQALDSSLHRFATWSSNNRKTYSLRIERQIFLLNLSLLFFELSQHLHFGIILWLWLMSLLSLSEFTLSLGCSLYQLVPTFSLSLWLSLCLRLLSWSRLSCFEVLIRIGLSISCYFILAPNVFWLCKHGFF